MSAVKKIGVVGAGAWGTALAMHGARQGLAVQLWAYEDEVCRAIEERQENSVYLKGIPLPQELSATSDLSLIAREEILLLATPAQHMRKILEAMRPHHAGGTLVICAKGLELKSGQFLSEVAQEVLGEKTSLAVLSGPSFAGEVAQAHPVALEVASEEEDVLAQLCSALEAKHFRLYKSRNMKGAQLGGAMKNVLAIACGIVEGLALGENAHAAILTRAFAEIVSMSAAMGIEREAVSGLSGLGDLLLTCSSRASRNMSLGAELGKGRALQDILKERRSVSEGVQCAPALVRLAKKHRVHLPISSAVHQILEGKISAKDAWQNFLL